MTLVLAACVLGLVSSCGKTAFIEQDPTDVSYSRSGVSPVTLSAFNETRTTLVDNKIVQWNQGDVISLMSKNSGSVKCLSLDDVHKMKVGEKKSIIVVNPSKSGHFLGFTGKDVLKYTGDLSSLNGGKNISEDEAEKNLKILQSNAEDLMNKEEYVFMLERVQEGWLLYHKASGIGLTETIGEPSGGYNKCVLGTELAPLGMEDASSNEGTTNVVSGRPEQIYVRNSEYYLRSNIPLCWAKSTSGWTMWLFFEIPGNRYQFTADEAGVSVTFTNKTGFEAGEETWFAVYPESVFPTINDGKMSFVLPSMQDYEAGSFKDRSYVTAGVLKDDQILFRSLLGVLQLSLKGNQHVLSISVKDNAGASLWGDASVELAQFDSEDCSATVSGGGPTLKLDCGKGVALQNEQATDFYLVVPVGAFSKGFKVEINTTEGVFARTTSKDNTIARGDIKEMPAFTLNPEQAEVREVNVENEVVAAYMAMGTYPSFGEGRSYFSYGTVYTLANACKWSNDQPVGVTISLDGEPPFVLTVTQDGEEWYTKNDFTGTEYTITNLTPGSTYTYTMTDGNGERSEGKFKAVGQVRMVSIQDAWNFRDLGGWTGLAGAKIKYGKLFRGGSLNGTFEGREADYQNADYNKFTFHGQEDVDHLGIRAELDLRGDPKFVPGLWGKEQNAHSVSLLQTKLKDATFFRIMSDYGLYYPFQRSSIIQDVAWMIQELQAGRPVAFHCRSGADRTGAVSLLIEGLLGVSEGDAARDYELTSLSPETNQRYANSVNSSFQFFSRSSGLFSIKEGDLTFQEQCYYYLNKSFDDVHINAKDLDWFICEMLGLTSYTRPDWAEDYPDNELSKVYSISTGSGSYTYP